VLERAWGVRLARNGLENPLGAAHLDRRTDGLVDAPVAARAGTRGVGDQEGSLETWLALETFGIEGGGTPRGGVDRFGRPRTRLGPQDVSLPAREDVAIVLEMDEATPKLALLLDDLQATQRRVERIINENTRRLARGASGQELRTLSEENDRLTRASRRLGLWIRGWFELADAGDLDD